MTNAFYPQRTDAGRRISDAIQAMHDRDHDLRSFAWRLPRVSVIPEDIGPEGPLAGLAFGVKDVIDVAGMPTRAGSLALPDAPKPFDAACVAQLRRAGAFPIGKTVTAEFAFTTPGPTRNPHGREHTPGGSSSGSAAAVAAGIVDMALGTQTGGSIIRPAAFCGVVGFKPTFGRVHRGGMQVLCDSLDTIGWFTRTIAQSRAIAAVLTPSPALAGKGASPRFALLECASLGALSVPAQDALRLCVQHLRDLGAHLCTPALDTEIDQLTALHAIIMRYELSRGLLPILASAQAKVGQAARDAMGQGLAIDHGRYVNAQRQRAEISARWLDRFADVDFIVAPSAPGEAPKGLASTGSSIFNRLWSLLGWPCVHLPTGTGEHGLPVGVQWIGKPDTDATLLHWADLLHRGG
ncbi:amidase [Achromobacter aloeverae]|nr:amidase [Achromobacter aloeverae]